MKANSVIMIFSVIKKYQKMKKKIFKLVWTNDHNV